MARTSFEDFMRQVDHHLLKRCGMTSMDIDDWRYRDDYEDGVSPSRSAGRALRYAKGYDVE